MQDGQKIEAAEQVVLSKDDYQSLLELRSENLYLKQELAQLKRMIFGSKSERYVPADTGQLTLGLGTKQDEQEQQEPESEQVSYTRKKDNRNKKKPVRLALPSHLHRETTIIEPEDDISGAKKIGEEVTEILEYTPGKFYVEKYIRPKYALAEDKGIVIGELPSLPIPKGNAGPGLLAHLLISKFVDHLPFYRQVQQFKRDNVEIAESTISGWFTATCRLLTPLYQKLLERATGSDYIMADETPIKVQSSHKKGVSHKGYHWVYYSPTEKVVCFDYREGRGREGPKTFLKDYKGTVQTDGYAVYDYLEKTNGITLLACMAHARRKFDKAKDNAPKKADHALKLFQRLYRIERRARKLELPYAQRKKLRIKRALPILNELEKWLKAEQANVLPKSAIGEAINYTLSLWKRLVRYVENGSWEIDNNLIENSIRPVALGRKNYLFAGSHEAAQNAAMMYSFLGTCKINNVEPYQWLKETLSSIQDHSAKNIDQLLPIKKD